MARLPPTRSWGPYLDARSHVVAELADQVRLNAEGEAPAWAAEPNAHMPAELIDDVQVWRAATRVDPGDLQPTGPRSSAAPPESSNSNSTSGSPPRIPTEGDGGNCSPQKSPALLRTHSCPNWAGFDATLLVRSAAIAGLLPDDDPAAALWWRIVDQLPENAKPGPRHPRRRPSDSAHDHEITRPAATQAALAAASRVRPEPLKTSTHHNAGEVFCRACCRTFRLFEVVPGIYQVRSHDIWVRDGSARRVQTTFGGTPLTCAITTYPQGGVHPEEVRRR
jgi:hypothetical protein